MLAYLEEPPIPNLAEADRLAVLRALDIIDTPRDPALDALVELAARTFKTATATISLVDQDRQWFKASVGAAFQQCSRDIAFCSTAIRNDAVMVVPDAAADPRFQDNPLVSGEPHIRFYAGAPLTVRGARIGTFCVIDSVPRRDFGADAQAILQAMATAVAATLDLRHEVQTRRATERSLDERTRILAMAESVAGLGHWRMDLPSGTVHWSDEVYRIHGLEPGQFDGDINDAIQFYVPEDVPIVRALVDRAILTGRPFSFKHTLIRASDGAHRRVASKGEVTLDADGNAIGLFGVFQDITEQEQLLQQAILDREKFRLLSDNAQDLIIVSEASGVMTYVSPSSVTLLGYQPEELLGRRTTEFIHPDDMASVRAVLAGYLSFGPTAAPVRVQCRLLHRNGTSVCIESHPRAIFSPLGTWVGFQDSLRDVTAQRHLEKELVAARGVAEASAQAKSDFVANMSHELRTPLNSILGFTDVLAGRPGLGAEERRFVGLIHNAGSRLLGIVNDVLDLSKIEAGAISLNEQPTDLCVLLVDTLELVRGQAIEKGLCVSLDLAADATVAMVDSGRLRQVLLNLLGNAIKFTNAGSITLAFRAVRGRGRMAVEIAVSDTGVGIPADVINRLFQRFEQADSSISRRYGGTGLGLSICRALAECMGGTIDVTSVPGQGSCFTVRLDLEDAELPSKPQAVVAAVEPELAGLRLLVAEDVMMNRELIGIFLEPCDMRIDYVENGVAAVDAAARAAYDAILMDMQMPVMDGLEAARSIRAGKGPSAAAPIIALTANVLDTEMERCRQAGMDDHVGKPFNARTLIGVLTQWAPAHAALRLKDH